MVAPLSEQLQELSLYRSCTLEEKQCCSYYSKQGDGRQQFERQIKNRTLYTCRLFLLTRIFGCISNWSKVLEHLPTLFLQSTQSNNFSKFSQINNFSVDYAGLYINWANTSLFIIQGTLPALKIPIKSHPSSRQLFFSDAVSVSNYHGCIGEALKSMP